MSFSFNNCSDPLYSTDPFVQLHRICTESIQRCAVVDRRINEMESDFRTLKREFLVAKEQGDRRKMVALTEKLDINRDLRQTLYKERWRRT